MLSPPLFATVVMLFNYAMSRRNLDSRPVERQRGRNWAGNGMSGTQDAKRPAGMQRGGPRELLGWEVA